MFPTLTLLLLATSFAFQETGAPDTSVATQDERRAQVLATADRYLTHRWTGSERNVHHGPDVDGVSLDTPDSGHLENGYRMDGSENVGIPYQWGGFSTPEDFDRALAEGLAAGHIPSGRGASMSRHAAGVDCSGFVSRCWHLAAKRSTRSLPELCVVLDDWDELRPGDALNTFNGHVVLFVEFADDAATRATIVEAAFPGVRRRDVDLDDLREQGYQALRYGPLDRPWSERGMRFAPATSRLGADGELVLPATAVGDANAAEPSAPSLWIDTDSDPFAAAKPGTWVEYLVSEEGGVPEPDRRLRIGYAGGDEDSVRLHLQLVTDEGVTELQRRVARDSGRALACALAMELRGEVSLDATVEGDDPADAPLAGRALTGQGTWDIEGREIPFVAEVETTMNHAVPVMQIVRTEARINFGTTEEPVLRTYRAVLQGYRDQPAREGAGTRDLSPR